MHGTRRVNRKLYLVCVILLLVGCSVLTSNRSGSDWIELAYSGLVAEDNYRFTGSVASGFENGPQMTPYSFEGIISDHKQIALYAEESSSLVKNPMSEFEFMVKNYSEAKVIYDGVDEENNKHIVVVQVIGDEAAVTARLKEQLRQELSNVTIGAISQAEVTKKNVTEIKNVASEATEELEAMLNSLDANLTYTITIDAKSARPVKMDEHMSMTYEKAASKLKEFRKTNIIFYMSGYKASQK